MLFHMHRLMPPLALAICTLLTYAPSLHYDFQFDDIANIPKHFYIRHHSLGSLFFSGSRWISYWLNALHYSINKFDPFSYRVGNMLIHITNGIFLFYILLFALMHCKGRPFFKRHALALATTTSTLFLLHPVQTQTVLYVCQGQLEGLACMGILGMILTFLHLCYASGTVRKIVFGSILFAIAALSCCTKEIAIISPVLLLLVDWFFVARGSSDSLKSRWPLHAALFTLVFAIYIWLLKPAFFTSILGLSMTAKNNVGNIITSHAHEIIRPWPFFISQFKVIVHYLLIFLWPFNISVEYDWLLCRSFFALDCLAPLAALICLAALIARLLYKNKTDPLAFGALWFAICIAPRSSIIPSPELLVDYKTYTASIGWLFICACGIITLGTYLTQYVRITPFTRSICASLLVIPLCIMTLQRAEVWSEGTKFWMNVIQNAPNKARAYNNYAVELSQNHKKYAEAIPYFCKAARMDKTYSDPLNNLAVCYSHLHQIDKAIQALQQSLAINPYYAEGYNNLASFYLQKNEYDTAATYLQTALQIRPHYGKAYINLGRMHLARNEQEQALDCFKKACTIADLDNELGYTTYAHTALAQKKYTEAIWGYKKALACTPGNTELLFTLASTYFLAEQYIPAREIYTDLLAKNKEDMRVWYNLGDTYLAEKKYAQALTYFKHIEPHWEKLPQTRIRLAHCYEKMGDVHAARNELSLLAQNKHVAPQLRGNARQLLAQLNAHYGQAALQQDVSLA